MPMLDSAAGPLAYFDNAPVRPGAPVVMLLHSSAASGMQWRKLVRDLTPGYRTLVPDLVGYGLSPSTAAAPTMADEIARLRALAELADGPFHLIGHSYGAAVALELARAMPERIASIALYEPVAFALLRMAARQAAWDEIAAVATRHICLVEAGDLAGAAVAFLDYWVAKGALRTLPEELQHYIVRSMGKVAAEWRMTFAAAPRPDDFAVLTMPVLLLAGEATTLASRGVADLLRELLPAAEWRLLSGLPHMAPVSQADQVNPLFLDFLQRQAGGSLASATEPRQAIA